jgi:hypothetical protein
MRFAAMPMPKSSEPRSPAAEFVRRLLGEKVPPQPSQAELPPADLDQRVRLIGEW